MRINSSPLARLAAQITLSHPTKRHIFDSCRFSSPAADRAHHVAAIRANDDAGAAGKTVRLQQEAAWNA